MNNNYFGEANLGKSGSRKSKKSTSSSSSSNSSNSDKPKQPQRGLGVAQLEKIRLNGLSASAYPQYPSLHTPPPPPNYPTNLNNQEMRVVQSGGYCSIPSSSFPSSSSSPSYAFNNNMMMELGEYQRTNIRYGDSQPTTNPRWDASTTILDQNQHFAQLNSMSTGHLLNQQGRKHRSRSVGSSSTRNSESSDNQELDLELRLSL